MLSNEFLNGNYSYRVNIADMDIFIRECEEEGLRWRYTNYNVNEFNPFRYYEGDKLEYLTPVMEIDDRNYVYIRCFYGMIDFSFHYNWGTQPAFDYVPSNCF